MMGLVFDIQRFSVHNGPGIRTTVYLKGCPLACCWCHNPEGRDLFPENMDVTRRLGDREFIESETVGAEMTADEVMEEVAKDQAFYEESGGGVTFSGGEPLAQPEFLVELLEACKRKGVHTALDTCGYAAPAVFQKIMPLTDLFLFDLKLVDSRKHLQYTGVENSLIHDNLRTLVRNGKAVFLRLPVIPGINNTRADIVGMKQLLCSLEGEVPRLHLLPYHHFGKSKYERLGKTVHMPAQEISQEEMAALKLEFEGLGFNVIIGG